MDTILAAIGKYTDHTVTPAELTAGSDDPLRAKLAHAVERAAYAVARVEEELGQVTGWVTDKTVRVRLALTAHPGQPAPTLNPLGELQAHAARFDALISERAARIEHLQTLVAVWAAQATPPSTPARHTPSTTDRTAAAQPAT
jgi:hypothetical protein